jgi:hypothetical protein
MTKQQALNLPGSHSVLRCSVSVASSEVTNASWQTPPGSLPKLVTLLYPHSEMQHLAEHKTKSNQTPCTTCCVVTYIVTNDTKASGALNTTDSGHAQELLLKFKPAFISASSQQEVIVNPPASLNTREATSSPHKTGQTAILVLWVTCCQQ